MNLILGIAMILIGIIISVAAINNIRKIKGFSLANGGMSLLYISFALVSVGVYLI